MNIALFSHVIYRRSKKKNELLSWKKKCEVSKKNLEETNEAF